MKVFLLLTCHEPELFPYTRLVFDSIRTGFPSSEIVLRSNRLSAEHQGRLEKPAKDAGAQWEQSNEPTIHHEWIENLVKNETDPFWICDSDVIFYESVEHWRFDTALAGYRMPEWQDEFAGAITRARLHPSLMWINPRQVVSELEKATAGVAATRFTPLANPFYPQVLPFNGRLYFYDTVAILYHTIGGSAFTDRQKEAYFHFHFGTISNLVLPKLAEAEAMRAMRLALLARPSLGRGQWRTQEEYLTARQPQPGKPKFKAPEISPEDQASARKWCDRLCAGNQDAMLFCDLWYRYCHAIDDLLDTIEDGRPTMSKEQILSVFFCAAFLYNSRFYLQNAGALGPVVLMVTNMYSDSVAWEKSPLAHRRAMADVLRTCGDEMYFMIALLCGGLEHMREMSLAIRERDWLGQHDKDGYPT